MQIRLIFSLFSVVTLKINLLTIPMIQHIKFGQNPPTGSADRVQTKSYAICLHSYSVAGT